MSNEPIFKTSENEGRYENDSESIEGRIENDSRSNYYLIAGISVVVGILVLVAICICIMHLCKLVNVYRKPDRTDYRDENRNTELEEISPLAINVSNPRSSTDFPPPTYTETTSV